MDIAALSMAMHNAAPLQAKFDYASVVGESSSFCCY